MKVDFPIRLETRIRAQTWKEDEPLRQDLSFGNIVLDAGWDNFKSRIFTGDIKPDFLFLGTGTTEPAATDTGLESRSGTLAAKPSDGRTYSGLHDPPNDVYSSVTLRFDYGEGVAEGSWTELGLAYDSGYTEPYNRSLFRDGNGDPITVQVLSNEYLRIYVELRLHFPTAVSVADFDYNGTTVSGSLAYDADRITSNGDFRDNPWESGRICASGFGLEPISPSSQSRSQTIDQQNLSATTSLSIEPGSEVEITGVGLFHDPDYLEPWFIVSFSPTITKPVDHRLAGSATVTFSRGA